MTQLIVAFLSFAHAPKQKWVSPGRVQELSFSRKLTSLYGLRHCSVLGHGTGISISAAVGCTGPYTGHYDVRTEMTTVPAAVGREERSSEAVRGIA